MHRSVPKFDKDVNEMHGHLGIGCISDFEPQPLMVRSHPRNLCYYHRGQDQQYGCHHQGSVCEGHSHFLEMSGGDINATELVAAIVNQKDNLVEGIQYAQEIIDGSMTLLIMTPKGIYAARDKMGRTPVAVGKRRGAYCVSFESFAYLNRGIPARERAGTGRDRRGDTGRCTNPGEARQGYEDLYVFVGLLRISVLIL